MAYKPYKFLIVSVVQEVDDDGKVLNELVQENPTSVFGIDGLHEYAERFELELQARMAEARGIAVRQQ